MSIPYRAATGCCNKLCEFFFKKFAHHNLRNSGTTAGESDHCIHVVYIASQLAFPLSHKIRLTTK